MASLDAHTYERVDKPRGEFFHTNWTGIGGRVASSTCTVWMNGRDGCPQPSAAAR